MPARLLWIVVAAIAVVFGFVAWSFVPSPGAGPGVATPRGQFLSLRNGDTIEAQTVISLEADNVPAGHEVWVMEIHDALMWPKEPPVPNTATGQWMGNYSIAGQSGPMQLGLYVVPPEGQETIRQWLRHGQRTNDFPGLRESDIPGAQQLDKVDVTLSE